MTIIIEHAIATKLVYLRIHDRPTASGAKFHSNTLAKRFTANVGLQSVFAIAEDRDGNIWFGDRDTGAWRYDGASLVNYAVDPGLQSQMICDIYEDRDQRLLFAMASGGVYEFTGESFERRF